MVRIRYLTVLSFLLLGLVSSGCTGPSEEAPMDQSPSSAQTPAPAGDTDIMDSNTSTMEADMAELDNLLEEMDELQDINFNDLEGLSF